MLGTARAQYHLRQMLVFLNAHVLNRPEIMIAQATAKFDEAGHLTDAPTRELMKTFLMAFAEWIRRMKA